MRKQLTKPIFADKGKLVVIVCRLRRSQSYARISLWSACKGDDLSPHVPLNKLGILFDGKPKMVQPMYVRLIAGHLNKHVWQFNAEEDQAFCVIQEVDTSDEILARARVRIYGTASARTRRTLQDAIRFLRRYTENFIRRYARSKI